MKFQEAKNLKIDDTVFIIGNDNKVYSKRVIGVNLKNVKQVDITHTNNAKDKPATGFILPHESVFLKEKHALRCIMQAMDSQVSDIESKALVIRDRIKILEREEAI